MLISRDEHVLIRTARKEYRCHSSAIASTTPWAMALQDRCAGTIQPGDQYAEYIGEVAVYQSGTRYCAACATAPNGPLGDWVVVTP